MANTGHQLNLWTRDLVAASLDDCSREAQVDVSFLHRGFCIMGMPLRQPKDSLRPFSRHDGRFALTIEPASVTHPDGGLINIGVPFGPKARLIAMWMATEVQNPRRHTTDRILELNGITDWLEALGIIALLLLTALLLKRVLKRRFARPSGALLPGDVDCLPKVGLRLFFNF